MDDAGHLGEILPEEINDVNPVVGNQEVGVENEVVFNEIDYQQEALNDQQHAELNFGNFVADEADFVQLEEPMIEDVVIIAPEVNVANIFRKEGIRCDSEETIAAACANFAVPEGWIRLEWIDVIY